MSYGVIGSVLDMLFPTHLKYSGLALSGNLSAVIAGFMPALATVVLVAAGNASWGPALLAMAVGVISFTGVLMTRWYARQDAAAGVGSGALGAVSATGGRG